MKLVKKKLKKSLVLFLISLWYGTTMEEVVDYKEYLADGKSLYKIINILSIIVDNFFRRINFVIISALKTLSNSVNLFI